MGVGIVKSMKSSHINIIVLLCVHYYRLDESGQFRTVPAYRSGCRKIAAKDAAVILHDEIEFVAQSSQQQIMKLVEEDDAFVGMDLLHMMAVDILGRDSSVATIFKRKVSTE